MIKFRWCDNLKYILDETIDNYGNISKPNILEHIYICLNNF